MEEEGPPQLVGKEDMAPEGAPTSQEQGRVKLGIWNRDNEATECSGHGKGQAKHEGSESP